MNIGKSIDLQKAVTYLKAISQIDVVKDYALFLQLPFDPIEIINLILKHSCVEMGKVFF